MYGKRQRQRRLEVRIAGVGVLLAVAVLTLAGAAGAQTPTTICVPDASSKPVLSTNTHGECPAQFEKKTEVKYKTVQLPGTGNLETLDKLLRHLKYEERGVGGKPTIQVTGANLQIVSGSGKTNGPVNGAGNLIIGYDDEVECGTETLICPVGPRPHTGSHNLVLGTGEGYTSWGAILGGVDNRATAPATFVLGVHNVVSGPASSISGGFHSMASGIGASISGGGANIASGERSTVTGGNENSASQGYSTVSGGRENTAFYLGSVVGGISNEAIGPASAILGGSHNTALAELSSISGGQKNTTSVLSSHDAILGGLENEASGSFSSVSGGEGNTANGRASSILGGKGNLVETQWGHFP
jgi:hypothetical protein